MKKILMIFPAAILLCSGWEVNAQQVTPLSYREYMERVTAGNIEYAAERLNVDISEAEIVAVRVFNDPTLSVSYFNNSNWDIQMGYGGEVELSKTFAFGVRRARIDLARSEKELTEALLDDYFRNLRASATIAYLDALKQRELHKVRQDSYENVRRLATSDSLRYVLGEIKEVDAMQSRLEADMLHNELLQSEAELRNAFTELNLLTGNTDLGTVFQPEGGLQMLSRDFVVTDLVSVAQANRADIVAAMKNQEVAARALKLVRRERNTDFELFVGANRNMRVHNEEAPAPAFTGFSAGIAIPLKFSNFNKGSVRAAQTRQQQAEVQFRQVELQIQTEVMQSYRRYRSLSEQIKRYEDRLLEDARRVIEGKTHGYNLGEVSLLEVLDAQRTYNEVRSQYIETLFGHTAALVELERAAGIWDVEL